MKIFVSYHKPAVLLRSEILSPMFVGAALKTEEEREKLTKGGFILDSSGDNISDKNFSYCELTAQYWAWKNCRDDCVGFLHYRRHLDFKGNNKEVDEWGLKKYLAIDLNYIFDCGLTDEDIKNCVRDYDVVVPERWDVRNGGSKSNYYHYCNSKNLFKDHIDLAIDTLKRKYPDYTEDCDSYLSSTFGYYTNIFIMKKELFNKYCSFLFGILIEVEKKIDISGFNQQEKRVFGYLSEWLFGIFITKLIREGSYKIKHLSRTIVENTSSYANMVPICYCADSNYFYPLTVSISSVLKNSNVPSNLFFYIVDGGFSKKQKDALKSFIEGNGASVIFKESQSFDLDFLSGTVEKSHLSVAAYLRLFLPRLMPKVIEKIFYLDCDTLVRVPLDQFLLKDELFLKPVNAVVDILQNSNCKRLNLRAYVNSGVLFINCRLARNPKYTVQIEEILSKRKDELKYHDQDVLNLVYDGNIGFVDAKWNAQSSSYPGCERQNSIGKTAFIIHFISDRKPWIVGSNSPFQKEFDKYARISLYGKLPLKRQKFSLRSSLAYKILNRIVAKTIPRGSSLYEKLKEIRDIFIK